MYAWGTRTVRVRNARPPIGCSVDAEQYTLPPSLFPCILAWLAAVSDIIRHNAMLRA
jgi:hypothetical protein